MPYNSRTKEWEYENGDVVWYPVYPFLIKCVVSVNDYFRKQNEGSYLFYGVNEPVGHSLSGDELFDSFNDGKEELLSMHKYNGLHLPNYAKTLIEHRERTISGIKSTWGAAGIEAAERAKMDAEFGLHCYPDKIQGVDWFHILDLLSS